MIEIKLHWIDPQHCQWSSKALLDTSIESHCRCMFQNIVVEELPLRKKCDHHTHQKAILASCLEVLVCKVQSFKHCSNLWEGVEPLTPQKLKRFRAASKGRSAGTRGHWIHLVYKLHAPFMMVFGVTSVTCVTIYSLLWGVGWVTLVVNKNLTFSVTSCNDRGEPAVSYKYARLR